MKQITIDCSAISDSAQLHDLLAQELDFPDWYGRNLDALYDCLTELEDEVELVLTGWDPSFDRREDFEAVFADAAADNPALTVQLE